MRTGGTGTAEGLRGLGEPAPGLDLKANEQGSLGGEHSELLLCPGVVAGTSGRGPYLTRVVKVFLGQLGKGEAAGNS